MLLALSLNARHAPLEVREPFSFPGEDLVELADFLRPHLAEGYILSTCQRFEAYVVPWRGMAGECLVGLFAQYRGVDAAQLANYVTTHHDRQAARQLFRVAAGLESQILGEAQILGQARRALDAAREAGLVQHHLGKLVQHAISAGRRVREETGLGRGALSISRLAVNLARSRLGHLGDRTVVLVGAGETANLAAKALEGVGRLIVVNRTLARAQALAGQWSGEARPWSELGRAVEAADLVVGCTGTRQPTVSRELLSAAQQHRQGRPLLLVDLAVPRAIETASVELPGISLITLADLERQCVAHEAERLREVPRAEAIVEQELERAWQDWGSAQASSAVTALREQAEAIRHAELERASSALGSLPPELAGSVEYVTRAIVNKLLHQPTIWLKRNPTIAETALRDVFGVGAHP